VIDASAKGEATAFDAAGFVARVEPVLPSAYRLAAAMLHSSSNADDAVQEALFKAWRHFGGFRPEADMKPWLLTIVANECRGQRRNRWSSVVTFADRAGVEPSANVELDAEVADLRTALYRLPHDQRLVLVLRYYLDLNFDEMGSILKTSTKAAKSRTYRALERLRLVRRCWPMNETEIRSRLRKAMGEYDYKPRSSRELEAGLVRGAPSSHPGATGTLAVILAVLIVVSLVYVRVHSTHPTIPAESPIPASLLERMHIAAAGALVSKPNLVGTVGARTVTFVGAYADALNLSLIFRVSPASNNPLGFDVWWTGYGRDHPYSSPLIVGPDGYQYVSGSAHSLGGPTQLRVSLWDNWMYPGVYAASEGRSAAWSFTYDLKVRAATSLPVQRGVIPVGSWKVTVDKFEMTPSTIYIHTLIDGPPITANLIAIKSIAMLDEAGREVSFGGGSGGWGMSRGYGRVWEVALWWPMPTQATTYRLVITGGGGQYSTSIDIPAPPTS